MNGMILLNIGLSRFETWFQSEALIGVNIILIGFLLWMLYKRAVIPAIIGVIGISFVSIFIIAPERSREVAGFLANMFGLG